MNARWYYKFKNAPSWAVVEIKTLNVIEGLMLWK
jgi:hypothetical protein